MITLKTGKAIYPVCDVKNSNLPLTDEMLSSVSGKWTTLGLFFVENKDWTKAEIG